MRCRAIVNSLGTTLAAGLFGASCSEPVAPAKSPSISPPGLNLASLISSTTVAYWRFEEGTDGGAAAGAGSILDVSPSANHATPSGSPTYRAEVAVSPIPATDAANSLSLEFDDVSDKVTVGTAFPFNTLTDATLEFWLKGGTPGHYAALWGRPDGEGD